jgi:F-type H+-transporting ATPase subunit delta
MAIITNRYARAFADVVFDQKIDANQVFQQLKIFVGLINDNDALGKVWENPAISAEQKRGLLDALAARVDVFRPVRNFLAVLIDHHRIHQLEEISRAFERELHERLGLTEAEVFSARSLSDQERQALEQQISRLTGRRVIAKYATDSKLLGGAMVKIGSTIYDGSVRGQLHKIKEQLVASE